MERISVGDRIESDFAYHRPPEAADGEALGVMRRRLLKVAQAIVVEVPPGREQSLALTKLEEVMFWANAGVARSWQEKVDAPA